MAISETRNRARPAQAEKPETSSQLRRTGGVRFPLVDSLRAIAALSVFVFHIGGVAFPPHAVAIFTGRLNLGVTLFFVISGFLLYRPFVAARLIRGRHALGTGRYAWHRFLRIVPAYWVALTVIALWLGLPHVFSRDAIVYYGFGQVYGFRTLLGGVGQAWTLSIEVAFYVFLPFWAWMIRSIAARTAQRRLRIEFIALGVLALFSLIYKPVINGATGLDPHLWFALDNALPRYLDQFAIGMALAVASVWFETHRPPRAVKLIEKRPWIPWAGAGLALIVLATQFGQKQGEAGTLAVHYLGTLIALGLFLPAVFGAQHKGPQQGWVRRFLGHPVLIWIGVVSYGLYLWHLAVILQVLKWGGLGTGLKGLFLWIAVCLPPALALAAASWYGIERPSLLLRAIAPPAWMKRLAHSSRSGARYAAYAVGAVVAWIVLSTAINPPPGGTPAAAVARTAAVPVSVDGRGWVYIVATYDSRRLRVYQNARLIASVPATGRPGPTPASIEVGNYLGGAKWTGSIKYLAVYRSALTPRQIHTHFYAGLAAWTHFDSALQGTPVPAYLWRNEIVARGFADPAHPAISPEFSIEAWVKAAATDNRVVAYLPDAWFLQTDLLGRWRAGVISGGRPTNAVSTIAPPHLGLNG